MPLDVNSLLKDVISSLKDVHSWTSVARATARARVRVRTRVKGLGLGLGPGLRG